MSSESKAAGSLDAFREQLAETVSWCARRSHAGDLAHALRSPLIAPPPARSWAETVEAVAAERRLLLGRSWRRTLEPLGGGVLIRYRPTPPHSRGEARRASDGYFDARDVPPWDTWVCYVETGTDSYLVAWVPPTALTQVTRGLEASPGALSWTSLELR